MSPTATQSREEIGRLLPYLTPAEREELDRLLDDGAVWRPQPGPQMQAYWSEADELFFGGGGGGGKSDLLLGLAGTQHWRSIIFRRIFPSLRGIIERSREIFAHQGESHAKDSYNESLHIWRLGDGRIIELSSIQFEKDKENFRGRPHDLYGWDEVPEFSESQFRFVNGWNRTTRRGQRCRIVATGNPPSTTDGEWVIRYWAPWLDSQHPNPAKPGELRWFAVIAGVDKEVEDGTPFEYEGEMVQPRSRTFIPARLTDNPYLMQTGYMSVLQAMPEPLRSQMLYGDFSIGVQDDPWQVIPTDWVRRAQARWTPEGAPKLRNEETGEEAPAPMTAVGVDVARGGKDKTVLACRYGTWFAPLDKHAGSSTPDGPKVATLVLAALMSGGAANIDAIGVGASVYDQCRQHVGERAQSIVFSEAAPGRDRTGTLEFANLRAYAYWSLREALDPNRGDNIALPPDPEILADLCAPRWAMRVSGVIVEAKEDIVKRLGRSPDCGDAVVLACLPVPAPAVGVAVEREPVFGRPSQSMWGRRY